METLKLISGWSDLYGIFGFEYIMPVKRIWYD